MAIRRMDAEDKEMRGIQQIITLRFYGCKPCSREVLQNVIIKPERAKIFVESNLEPSGNRKICQINHGRCQCGKYLTILIVHSENCTTPNIGQRLRVLDTENVVVIKHLSRTGI